MPRRAWLERPPAASPLLAFPFCTGLDERVINYLRSDELHQMNGGLDVLYQIAKKYRYARRRACHSPPPRRALRPGPLWPQP